MKKRTRVEEEKSLKIKNSQSSELETNVKAYVQNIVPTFRRKMDGKIVLVNVPVAPLDNVSFQSKSSV